MRTTLQKSLLTKAGSALLGIFALYMLLMLAGWMLPPAFVPASWLAKLPGQPYVVVQFNDDLPNRRPIAYPVRDLPRAIQGNASYAATDVKDASGAAQHMFEAYLKHHKATGPDGAAVIDMAVALQLRPSKENTDEALRALVDSNVTLEEKRSLLYLAYTFHNQGAARDDQKSIQSVVREMVLNGDTALRGIAVSTYSQLYESHGPERGLLPPADAIDLLLDAADKKIIDQRQLVFELSDAVITAPPERRAELISIVRESGDITAIEKAVTGFTYLPDVARNQPPEVVKITLETLEEFKPTIRDADGGPVDGRIGFDFRQWLETYATYQSIHTGQNRQRIALDQLLDPNIHNADIFSYLSDENALNRLVPVARPGELRSLLDRSRDFVQNSTSDREHRDFKLTTLEENIQRLERSPRR